MSAADDIALLLGTYGRADGQFSPEEQGPVHPSLGLPLMLCESEELDEGVTDWFRKISEFVSRNKDEVVKKAQELQSSPGKARKAQKEVADKLGLKDVAPKGNQQTKDRTASLLGEIDLRLKDIPVSIVIIALIVVAIGIASHAWLISWIFSISWVKAIVAYFVVYLPLFEK